MSQSQISETYGQLSSRHQKEVNDFPLGFAFGKKQFEEMKVKLEIEKPDDLISIGAGGFVHRKNADKFVGMVTRQEEELSTAMKDGTFAQQAFRYELGNHEYGYTGNAEPALRALGLTYEEVESNEVLQTAYREAIKQMREY